MTAKACLLYFSCCISFNFLLRFLSLTLWSPSLLLWRRQWHPTPGLLPGKSHGRSLVGCSPWGHEESDATGRLPFHFSLSCIGEGNGTPLQCSCLENPRDGGAWWAAVYGVAESQTWLTWLSSSSRSLLLTHRTNFPLILFLYLSPALPFLFLLHSYFWDYPLSTNLTILP